MALGRTHMPQIAANGITMHYEAAGDKSAPAVLLISGVGTQLTRWSEPFTNALAARGYYVIRIDNRDIGLSQKFDFPALTAELASGKLPKTPYTLSDMAADAAAVLDGLGIAKAHIVGASMGGMIAQLIAIEHPDKALSLTSIFSTTGNRELPKSTPEAMAALTKPRPDALKDREAFLDSSLDTAHVIGSPAYPVADDLIRAGAAADLDRSYHPTGFPRQYAAIITAPDRRASLQKLTLPVVVIHGVEDPLVRVEGGRDTAANIPGSELIEIPGMGHNIPPQLTDTIIDGIERAIKRA
jgi:pimeloyl-ACP methyl ester carboxylesterase